MKTSKKDKIKLERCRKCKHYRCISTKLGILSYEVCTLFIETGKDGGHYSNCTDIGIGNIDCLTHKIKK